METFPFYFFLFSRLYTIRGRILLMRTHPRSTEKLSHCFSVIVNPIEVNRSFQLPGNAILCCRKNKLHFKKMCSTSAPFDISVTGLIITVRVLQCVHRTQSSLKQFQKLETQTIKQQIHLDQWVRQPERNNIYQQTAAEEQHRVAYEGIIARYLIIPRHNRLPQMKKPVRICTKGYALDTVPREDPTTKKENGRPWPWPEIDCINPGKGHSSSDDFMLELFGQDPSQT